METTNNERSFLNHVAYSLEDLTEVTPLSRPTINELVHIDGFPALRVGKRWLVPARAFEKWLEENCGKEF